MLKVLICGMRSASDTLKTSVKFVNTAIVIAYRNRMLNFLGYMFSTVVLNFNKLALWRFFSASISLISACTDVMVFTILLYKL